MGADQPCSVHRAKPSSFRCRACRRPFCEECRALGTPELCGRCEMTASLRESVDEKVEVRATGVAEVRKKRTALWLAVALVGLNVASAIFLAQSGASLSAPVREAFNDVEAVSRFVEASRDANRKIPATLGEVNPPLPTAIADKVRRGEIRYRPSEDRSTFTVEAALDPSVVDSESPAEPAGEMP